MEVSKKMIRFFKNQSNNSTTKPFTPQSDSSETFADMERNCSNIDQNLNEIKKDLMEISENMNTTFDVSSDCQYRATCTYVSLQTLAETTGKPTFINSILNHIQEFCLFISNILFSIYH